MSQLDASFFKPFIEGALNTFKVQCKTVAKPEAPFFKGTKDQPEFGIAGVIGIQCEIYRYDYSLFSDPCIFRDDGKNAG